MPPTNSRRLGHAGDLRQAFPADTGGGPGESLPPRVRKSQCVVVGNLLAQKADLSPEVGDFGDERFVLFGQQRCSDEANEKRQGVYGVREPGKLRTELKG